MTQPFYVEYKTLSTNSPHSLDRLVNELLGKEVRRESGVFRWTMYGPLSVSTCISNTSTHYATYTQAMALSWYRELFMSELKEDIQQKSILEQELDSATPDPITSFIMS